MNQPCAQVMVPYTVHLDYQPAGDRLGLTVEKGDWNVSTEAEDGYARLTFTANLCTSFDIEVAGLEVADEAAYTVVVERSSCPTTGATCSSP